jgi:hyperosmotically inducible protein
VRTDAGYDGDPIEKGESARRRPERLYANALSAQGASTSDTSARGLVRQRTDDADTDRTHPVAFVKDSAITTEVKTKLAADHLTGRVHIHVDTDQDGVVWLTGSATSRGALDRAVSIARRTEHVTAVHSDLVIKHDD